LLIHTPKADPDPPVVQARRNVGSDDEDTISGDRVDRIGDRRRSQPDHGDEHGRQAK
jgi:hypothetical protein